MLAGVFLLFLPSFKKTILVHPGQGIVAVPSALAGGHGGNSGHGSNAGGNGGGNGANDGTMGSGGHDGSDQPSSNGQDGSDDTGTSDAWPVGKQLDFRDRKPIWDTHLAKELDQRSWKQLELGEVAKKWRDRFEQQFVPGLALGKAGRRESKDKNKHERGSDQGGDRSRPTAQEGAKPAHIKNLAIDPRFYSPRELLAISLGPAGLDRAQMLGFKPGGSNTGVPYETAITTLIVPSSMDAVEAMALLKKELPAERFELNRIYRLYHPVMMDGGTDQKTEPASDGGTGRCAGDHCYGQTAIHWNDSFRQCAQDVRVGVIDTDIDVQHPAFRGQKITQRSFIPEATPAAASWHGTGVLALLAGKPSSGTPGLISAATFFTASIFFADDSGESVTDTVSLLRALDWMEVTDVKLVNMSFSGPQDDLVQSRIEQMSARGIVFIAAAGNDGPSADPSYPAAYPQVIAVTAVTKNLRNYPYANRGAHIDVAAPGAGIWTAVPGAREGYESGTSFAAPFMTAILSILPEEELRRPKDALLDRLKTVDLGPPGRDPIYGRGLAQAPATCRPPSGRIADLTQPP
jgi:hypothetical protein